MLGIWFFVLPYYRGWQLPHLHSNEIDIAMGVAIDTRRIYKRPSMLPYESAAIVRGLMRVGLIAIYTMSYVIHYWVRHRIVPKIKK